MSLREAMLALAEELEEQSKGDDGCMDSQAGYMDGMGDAAARIRATLAAALAADPEPRGAVVERPRWLDSAMAEPWHRDLVGATTSQHGSDLIPWAERVAETYGRSGSLEVTAVIWALLDRLDAQ